MKIYKDIRGYIRDLTNLVWTYIHHRSAFPANAMLAVQPELACNVIDSPDNCRNCDFYAPELLITHNAAGASVPNKSVIRNIARRYYY